MFSSEASNAIKSLEMLKEQLKNITEENIDEVIRGVERALKFIKEYLEKKKASL
jgi:hypothetical protein